MIEQYYNGKSGKYRKNNISNKNGNIPGTYLTDRRIKSFYDILFFCRKPDQGFAAERLRLREDKEQDGFQNGAKKREKSSDRQRINKQYESVRRR